MQDVNKVIANLQAISTERYKHLELQLALALEENERLKEENDKIKEGKSDGGNDS